MAKTDAKKKTASRKKTAANKTAKAKYYFTVKDSVKVVQDRAIKFAKQNAEAGFSLATELASAKDITDVLAIQSRYAQTQMQAYALQAQELGRLMAEATQSGMQHRG